MERQCISTRLSRKSWLSRSQLSQVQSWRSQMSNWPIQSIVNCCGSIVLLDSINFRVYNDGCTLTFHPITASACSTKWSYRCEIVNLSMTTPFSKQMTAGRTRIFNFSTKNLAFSTFSFANFVSKCCGAKLWQRSTEYKHYKQQSSAQTEWLFSKTSLSMQLFELAPTGRIHPKQTHSLTMIAENWQ